MSKKSSTHAVKPTDAEDHRTRVAKERRRKMRAHLLVSVLEVCPTDRPMEVAVIDDVVRHAGVSRGTFYRYFASLDQAATELGEQLADEMTASIAAIYEVLEEPVMRTATGFQLFLIRACMAPQWGGFIAHVSLLSEDNLLTRRIREDLQLGIARGDYDVPSVAVANDVLMGAKAEALMCRAVTKPATGTPAKC